MLISVAFSSPSFTTVLLKSSSTSLNSALMSEIMILVDEYMALHMPNWKYKLLDSYQRLKYIFQSMSSSGWRENVTYKDFSVESDVLLS